MSLSVALREELSPWFSIAITEALGFGTPVVITTDCHFPEVQAAGAGHVVALDGEAVGDALVDVLENPETRASMSDAAARLIREHYTWPKIAERFDTLFQSYDDRD